MDRASFNIARVRSALLIGSALVNLGVPTWALAETAPESDSGLEEIIVTAQKREQSLQDVPVAVTAISEASLETNRIVSVADLNGIAPNVTVRPAAGGTQIASFSVRGVNSYGVVPGSDKEVSINLDGVYISSARGSIFDIADIARIEVLRGPQGTLFGRNATAGAVSIITRDPTGKFGGTLSGTIGNYHQRRLRATLESPQVGPFSAYVTFQHNERRGDTVNTAAGLVWDKTGPDGLGKQTSPKTLGDNNAESVFAALKFEPSDSFNMVYKYDWASNDYTPEANVAVALNPNSGNGRLLSLVMNNQVAGVATTGAFVGQTIQAGVVPVFATSGLRTGFATNGWTVPGKQRYSGHNLTANWRATDNFSAKAILSYRKSFLYGASALQGMSGMVITPAANAAIQADTSGLISTATKAAYAAAVGNRLHEGGTQRIYRNEQYSGELQLNYTTELVNATAGGIYFHSNEQEGGPSTMWSSKSMYIQIPNSTGLLPQANGTTGAQSPNEARFLPRATSIAAYGQVEVHVLPVVDLVGGVRYTHDHKTGTSYIGGLWNPATPGDRVNGVMTYTPSQVSSFVYNNNQWSYTFGVNYKPNNDTLLYAKYSRSYVSGGQIGNLPWKPEIAKSWEAGAKTTVFDGKLRANLAVFSVTYDNLQFANGGAAYALIRPDLALFPTLVVSSRPPARARGVELELTAAPTRGLTLGANLGYTNFKFLGPLNGEVLSIAGLCGTEFALNLPTLGACEIAQSKNYRNTLTPKITSNLWAQWESEPLFNADTRLSIRLDAQIKSSMRIDANLDAPLPQPGWAALETVPSTLILNGRIALSDIQMGGINTTLALWGRNITDDKHIQFPGGVGAGVERSASFQQARTYGVDLTVKF
ncbi:TonB-dependent receptor [Novosphingobium sp. G106]|uniref:TonB-dependent receptor n=1 Tax=Novosphingobium sp. G106 TaxID=2849500 RepID=UPI001C2CDD4D|nr:TonB-dependent receptor [Novosphingobium sp. G106]MBV1687938.1 TonB-dependent receptor [Novosphingobium sp. G106]